MLGMCAPMRWRRWWWVLASSATCRGSRYLAGLPRPSWASWWLEWAGALARTPCTGVAPGVRPSMPGWQDVLSRPMHYALYAFLIATPILRACCCCVVASLCASGEHAGAGVAGAEVRLLRAGAREGLVWERQDARECEVPSHFKPRRRSGGRGSLSGSTASGHKRVVDGVA